MKQVGSTSALTLATMAAMLSSAYAIDDVDKDYVRSLAAPGKTVLVMEYSDAAGVVVDRKGFASADGFAPTSGTSFRIDANTTINLYGVEPCTGEMVNAREGYSGSCDAWALQGIGNELRNAKVIYCRAFVSEQNATEQDATCYTYTYFPGALDFVDNIEEQLVSTGFLRLSKDASGNPKRPDLAESDAIGRKGYGMWADPRVQAQ